MAKDDTNTNIRSSHCLVYRKVFYQSQIFLACSSALLISDPSQL